MSNNSSPASGTDTSYHAKANLHSSAYLPVIALACVIVPGRLWKARVLIETCSSITLISSCFAQQLKVKQQRLGHEIMGLNGTKYFTSKHALSCTLSSASVSGGEEVPILTRVVNVITSDYGPQDLSKIRSLPFS